MFSTLINKITIATDFNEIVTTQVIKKSIKYREVKIDFRYRSQYKQNVLSMHCARKKTEDNCIGSCHYCSQVFFGSRWNWK